MKCIDCPHYTGGYMFDGCGVLAMNITRQWITARW